MDIDTHLAALSRAARRLDGRTLRRWGARLADLARGDGRLLLAGSGPSAALAQHLTATLAERFGDRCPISALVLHADTSALTAIANDYGIDDIFARQVEAHGRPGDVLLVLCGGEGGPGVLAAVSAARRRGLTVWALTGSRPDPALRAVECLAVEAETAAAVRECQLIALHLLCGAMAERLGSGDAPAARSSGPVRRPVRPVPLVVIGDVLLDEDVTGPVERVSPEAPVVVVQERQRARTPGGAGLAAVLAAEAGHPVTLVAAVADDAPGRAVRELLADAGVALVNLPGASPTAVKTRFRSSGQTVLMVDRAVPPGPPPGPVPPEAEAAVRSAAAVLVADYGRGVASADGIRALLAEVIPRVPVVWDPHPAGPPPVPGVTVVTPNSREARLLADRDAAGGGPAAPGVDGDIACGLALAGAWRVGHAVVTRGAEGAILVSDDSCPPVVAPTPFTVAGDTRGAGDRFAVAVAAALGSGLTLSAAVRSGVDTAAAYVAGHRRPAGAAVVDGDGDEDAMAVVARVRAAGGTVVATGGCFDLLHRGHIALLQQARRLGDCLVVCLNSDDSVRRLKGAPRPLVPAADRAAVLRALGCVDAVVVFDEDTPERVLSRLRPDIYVKGGDYALSELAERVVVESGGGRVMLVPYLDGRSTTSLIERARVR